jgi:peroxiredoxin family protein
MELKIPVHHKTAEDRMDHLEEEIQNLRKQLEDQQTDNKVNIICFSREWDRLFAALTIASGALALGTEVHLFFTFWAVCALKDPDKKSETDRTLIQKAFGRIMPSGFGSAPMSNYNSMGLGKFLFGKHMKKIGIDDLDTLFNDVMDLGAQLHVCETSSVMLGISCEELLEADKINRCGVTTFLSHALKSKMTLFI